MGTEKSGQLRRVLGVGFGLAVSVGATIGVGILRTPGLVAGQVHTVRVEVAEEDLDAEDGGETVIRRFVELYEAKYGPGTAYRQAGVEVVTFTVEATASLSTPRAAWLGSDVADAGHARKRARDVYLSDSASFEQVAVYDAERLHPGNELAGPAVIEADDTTILVHRGQRLWVDGLLDLRIALT